MNALNRILVVIVFALLFISVVVAAIFPFGTLALVGGVLASINATLTKLTAESPMKFLLGQIFMTVGAALVFLPIIWLELTRRGPATVYVRTNSGNAVLTTNAVERRIAFHLDQLSDIVDVRPEVVAHGKKVDVFLRVRTTPDIEVPMKTEEIIAVTREIVEERMGMRLKKINVQIDHSPPLEDEIISE